MHRAAACPVDLLTDDSRLRQVLRNLLSNAVKFTEIGGVELRIAPGHAGRTARRPCAGTARRMAFQVRDTGIGIAEHQLETIFGAFQQADGTTSRKYGGTGLGLSISREIAYLLGGVITAESVLGSGSTFTLYLPIARPDFLDLAQQRPALTTWRVRPRRWWPRPTRRWRKWSTPNWRTSRRAHRRRTRRRNRSGGCW